MRHSPSHPAKQLHSAALRYRSPVGARGPDERSRSILHARGGRGATAQPAGSGTPDAATGKIGAGSPSSRRDPRISAVEAVLFLSREPLGTRKLAQLAGLADGTEARTLIRRLNDLYDAAGRAFRAEEVAGGYQLLTRPRFAPWLGRLAGAVGEVRFSQPAMETLAVVAYRQPVLRAEIEAVRGVQCGEMLRQLMERGMVRIVGRADELGRPILYGTSRKFLQVFGLRHLDDLPRAAVLRRQVDESVISSVTPTSLVTADVNQKEPDAMSASIAAATGAELEEDEKRLGTTVANPLFAPRAEEDDDLDDDEDEDDDDEDDDDDDAEDAEEEEWEEVEDEDELDEDEDEDEDDEDEDWDDDDDEDWDDEEDEDEDDDDEDDSWDDDDEEEEEEADEEE